MLPYAVTPEVGKHDKSGPTPKKIITVVYLIF